MGDILVCGHCHGPMPAACSACPHCKQAKPRGRRPSRFGTRVKQFALGASASMTLTACYGAAPPPSSWNPTGTGGTAGTGARVEFPTCEELAENLRTPDTDKDGYCGIFDCNESDPKINAAAADIPGDGIDQNCNGEDKALPPDAGQ
jgi:hypothetical protein